MTSAGDADVTTLGHVSLVVLSWADLVLDSDNPRLEEGGGTTRESVNALLEQEADKMVNIARDISESGMLSPFDLPGVVWEDEAYVVVEGNRRVAALKMLKAPDLIDDNRIRRRIEGIAQTGTGPDDVACSLFEDRESASRWIELRHTGENDGRGVSPWDSDMSNRFSREPGSQTDLAMQLRAMMSEAYPGDSDLLRQLEVIFRGGYNTTGQRVRKRPTTLGRLIEAPPVQEAFGYTTDAGNVVIVGPLEKVHAAFRQMIFDVSEGMTAREINTRTDIENYIDLLSDLKVTPPTAPARPQPSSGPVPPSPGPSSGSATPSGPAAPSGGGSGSGGMPTPPAVPTPRRRMPRVERKIFEGLKLNKFNLITSKTLDQAQRADIDTMPAVAGVMLRVIVELCVTEAIEKLKLKANEGDKLFVKIRVCLLHLDPNLENAKNRDKTLEPVWINSQRSAGHGLSVVLMNAFVHGLHQNAAPSEVRTLSTEYKTFLQRLNDALP
ncbi:hypothetical protein [Mycobacterium syngnathidarum]